jgi:hypothetical protein
MQRLMACLILCSTTILTSISYATLGEHVSTVDNDISKLKASQKLSTANSNYTIHEMTADGNTIKEYASADGVVFAVSWRGISKPDLSTLFGSYFQEYKTVDDNTPKQMGKRSVTMKTSKMVLRRGGHMRDMRGFAYIPSLVPSNVNIEDLQ